jgi:predicted O-methyltransferase YrrM
VSEQSSVVTEQHFAYVAERTAKEDAFLAELKKAAKDAGIPPIWIAPEQASLIQILLKLASARRVIEIGTLAGYSAIAMARALPEDGRVDTIELSEAHAAFAEKWIARSDVAGRVTVHRGAGVDVLPQLADGSADAAFIDADKPSYPRYLTECQRILRRGGLVMVDNAFAFGQLFEKNPKESPESVEAMRAFNDHMAAHPGFHGIIVPIGDGMWVGVRR